MAKDSVYTKLRNDDVSQLEADFKNHLAEKELDIAKKNNALKESQLQSEKLQQRIWALLTLTVSLLAITIALSLRQRNAQSKLLLDLNEEIKAQHEKISEQHEMLQLNFNVMNSQNEELKSFRTMQQVVISNQERNLQKAFEQLKNRNQQMIEFSRINSHNVRGPLARILGLSDILNKADSSNLEKEFLFKKIKEAGLELDRVVNYINDILSFSESGQDDITRISLTEIANEVRDSLLHVYPNICWVLTTDEIEDEYILANRISLKSIFYFLIDNAIKFRSQKPLEVKIKALKSDNRFFISIMDNGIKHVRGEPCMQAYRLKFYAMLS